MKNKRFLALLLAVLMIIPMAPKKVEASNRYTMLDGRTSVLVLEAYDGASFLGRTRAGEMVLVDLAGVEPMSQELTLDYLRREVMGNYISCLVDSVIPVKNRWNPAYVYPNEFPTSNDKSINEEMIRLGLAAVSSDLPESSSRYKALKDAEDKAKQEKVGIWEDSFTWDDKVHFTPTVNVNIASKDYMLKELTRVPAEVIDNIISYRQYAPFNQIKEVKYVEGFTNQMYLDNRDKLKVATNINTATEDEFKGFREFTQQDADGIIRRRNETRFSNIKTLYEKNIISRWKYDIIAPYIYTVDITEINEAIPNIKVNVNRASQNQLTRVGFTVNEAKSIIANRSERYSFKNIGELSYLSQSPLSDKKILKVRDNLTTITKINECSRDEMESLFGGNLPTNTMNKIMTKQPDISRTYLENEIGKKWADSVVPFITFDYGTEPTVNLNLADEFILKEVGFNSADAAILAGNRKRMQSPKDVPINLGEKDKVCTLYTDINTASFVELGRLHQGLDKEFVDKLIAHREKHIFGNRKDIENFFKLHYKEQVYMDIRNFITIY